MSRTFKGQPMSGVRHGLAGRPKTKGGKNTAHKSLGFGFKGLGCWGFGLRDQGFVFLLCLPCFCKCRPGAWVSLLPLLPAILATRVSCCFLPWSSSKAIVVLGGMMFGDGGVVFALLLWLQGFRIGSVPGGGFFWPGLSSGILICKLCWKRRSSLPFDALHNAGSARRWGLVSHLFLHHIQEDWGTLNTKPNVHEPKSDRPFLFGSLGFRVYSLSPTAAEPEPSTLILVRIPPHGNFLLQLMSMSRCPSPAAQRFTHQLILRNSCIGVKPLQSTGRLYPPPLRSSR